MGTKTLVRGEQRQRQRQRAEEDRVGAFDCALCNATQMQMPYYSRNECKENGRGHRREEKRRGETACERWSKARQH